jgi:hypothetical protein
VTGYHILAIERAAFRADRGAAAEERAGLTRGMLIILPPESWTLFHSLDAQWRKANSP